MIFPITVDAITDDTITDIKNVDIFLDFSFSI